MKISKTAILSFCYSILDENTLEKSVSIVNGLLFQLQQQSIIDHGIPLLDGLTFYFAPFSIAMFEGLGTENESSVYSTINGKYFEVLEVSDVGRTKTEEEYLRKLYKPFTTEVPPLTRSELYSLFDGAIPIFLLKYEMLDYFKKHASPITWLKIGTEEIEDIMSGKPPNLEKIEDSVTIPKSKNKPLEYSVSSNELLKEANINGIGILTVLGIAGAYVFNVIFASMFLFIIFNIFTRIIIFNLEKAGNIDKLSNVGKFTIVSSLFLTLMSYLMLDTTAIFVALLAIAYVYITKNLSQN